MIIKRTSCTKLRAGRFLFPTKRCSVKAVCVEYAVIPVPFKVIDETLRDPLRRVSPVIPVLARLRVRVFRYIVCQSFDGPRNIV